MAVQTISGIDLIISVEGTPIGCADTINMSIDTATSTAACRASGGWAESVAAQHSWNADASGIQRVATGTDKAGNKTYSDLTALQLARTVVDIVFGTSIVGDTKYTGTAIITSTKATSPLDGAATFTVSFLGTGPLVASVN